MTTYLGVKSPAARLLLGRPIPSTGRGPVRLCDAHAHGHDIGLAILRGRSNSDCHDEIAARLLASSAFMSCSICNLLHPAPMVA
jgi:hypothetical protein